MNPTSLNVKADDLVLASFIFSLDALQRIKHPIAEDLKKDCTKFKVLCTLAWRVRTIKIYGCPLAWSPILDTYTDTLIYYRYEWI